MILNDIKNRGSHFLSSFVKFNSQSWRVHSFSKMDRGYFGAGYQRKDLRFSIWQLLCWHDVNLHSESLRTPGKATEHGAYPHTLI